MATYNSVWCIFMPLLWSCWSDTAMLVSWILHWPALKLLSRSYAESTKLMALLAGSCWSGTNKLESWIIFVSSFAGAMLILLKLMALLAVADKDSCHLGIVVSIGALLHRSLMNDSTKPMALLSVLLCLLW